MLRVQGLLVFSFICCHAALAAPSIVQPVTLESFEFVSAQGASVPAEKGTLLVPERHQNDNGKRMSLKFVRFKSTASKPGAPVVYLAGGPGGSGIQAAKGERFPLFMKLRETADVIVLDQRGTGESTTPAQCVPPGGYPMEQPLQLEPFLREAKKAAEFCASFWRDAGIDINAYTTRESAADVAALRSALGYAQVNLLGISYGGHLALATAKYHPSAVASIVLASSEGLGQTIKLPAHVDVMLGRLAKLAHPKYPDLLGTMRKVHQMLDASPVVVDGVGIGKLDIQLLASYMIKNPREASTLPALYSALEARQYQFVAGHVKRMRKQMATWDLMPVAMDASTGIDASRLSTILKQAETSVLGRASDLPHPDVAAALGIVDLGEEYRRELSSQLPVLVIAGTLDGRTVLESQLELARALPRSQILLVHNAGHDLLMTSPVIGDAITQFLRGKRGGATEVTVEPPTFM